MRITDEKPKGRGAGSKLNMQSPQPVCGCENLESKVPKLSDLTIDDAFCVT